MSHLLSNLIRCDVGNIPALWNAQKFKFFQPIQAFKLSLKTYIFPQALGQVGVCPADVQYLSGYMSVPLLHLFFYVISLFVLGNYF